MRPKHGHTWKEDFEASLARNDGNGAAGHRDKTGKVLVSLWVNTNCDRSFVDLIALLLPHCADSTNIVALSVLAFATLFHIAHVTGVTS